MLLRKLAYNNRFESTSCPSAALQGKPRLKRKLASQEDTMKVAAALGIMLAMSAPAVLADAGQLERLNAKRRRYGA